MEGGRVRCGHILVCLRSCVLDLYVAVGGASSRISGRARGNGDVDVDVRVRGSLCEEDF